MKIPGKHEIKESIQEYFDEKGQCNLGFDSGAWMSEKHIYDDEQDKEMAALADIEAQPHPGEDQPQDEEPTDGE